MSLRRPRRLGVFGGSFDPVHAGHLRLARWARRALGLDEVWLVPCARSADGKALAPGRLRLRWLRAALRGQAGLRACDWELKRGGLSRTVDTLRQLRRRFGAGVELTLLLGQDQARRLPAWKQARRLPQLAGLAVFGRGGAAGRLPAGYGLRRLPSPACAVSSTQLRERLRAGLSVRRLLPAALRDEPSLARAYGRPPRLALGRGRGYHR